jgi:FeS assembly SUF system protein
MDSINQTIIEAQVIEALRTCFDPEIPVNIYEMGLIYEVKVDETGKVTIQMTLTSPSCPAAQSIPAEVEQKVRAIDGVTDVQIDLVWEPPWDQNKMSEAARLQLGCFDRCYLMSKEKTLFERLGGEIKLREIIDCFIDRVFADRMIGFFFRNADRARLKKWNIN